MKVALEAWARIKFPKEVIDEVDALEDILTPEEIEKKSRFKKFIYYNYRLTWFKRFRWCYIYWSTSKLMS